MEMLMFTVVSRLAQPGAEWPEKLGGPSPDCRLRLAGVLVSGERCQDTDY